jgi:2-phospho-L-lactate guanylyltransferase
MIGAIVPAKALDHAKTRLAALLSEEERRRLALAMLEDVVRALHSVPRIDTVAVVSPDSDVLERALDLGVQAIVEPESVRGINGALSYAWGVMSRHDLTALLVVLADVPAVTRTEIESVLNALPGDQGLAICPSRAGGTSALALRPPDIIPFRFGPNSFDAHMEEASARELAATVLDIDSLARDIDEPDDLYHLMYHPAETATHRLLADICLSERLSVKR